MVVSWNAWQTYSGTGQQRYAPSDFSDQEVQWFTTLRPRVRGSGEYLVLYRALDRGIRIQTNTEFLQLSSRWAADLHDFSRLFARERLRLRSFSAEHWVSLNPSFPEVLDFARRMTAANRFVIASLKDRKSVRILLDYWGIELADSMVYANDIIDSKLGALQEIANEFGLPPSKIRFVDDNFNHLRMPLEAGFDAQQSSWGNVLQEYTELAERAGVVRPTLQDLGEWY